MPEPAEPAADDVLADRYRLRGLLGSGGMADVYRATDLRLDRDVAIKLFRDGVDPLVRRRLTDEATLLARLSCPGLVAVYDIGTADSQPYGTGRPYLVMQLIDGMTLRDRLIGDPLAEPGMLRLGAQLAEAIGYVHLQGIVHRDIKPSNVLLDGQDRPWLADFGISLLLGSTRLTATGQLIGTAGYLAPEQVLGGQVGPAADVYALGLVLIECLTGFPEYDGSDIEVAVARLHRQPRIPGGLSAPVGALLTAMTSADPAQRPDAASCAAALRSGADGPGAGLVGPAVTGVPGGAPMAAATQFHPTTTPGQGPATRQLPAVSAAGPATRQFDGPLVPPEEPAAPVRRRSTRMYVATAAVLLVVAAIGWALLSSGGTPQPVQQAVPPPESTTAAPATTTPVPVQNPGAADRQPTDAQPTSPKRGKPGHGKGQHGADGGNHDG